MTGRLAAACVGAMLCWSGSVLAQAPPATARYPVTGMVLEADPANRRFVASIDRIPGFMDAMTMPFQVKDGRELAGVGPGTVVEFTLVVEREASVVEGLRIVRHRNLEQDPIAARRLALLRELAGGSSKPLAVGDAVPDFRLIDQASRPVSLSAFRGKVVGINFTYTTCQLPDFCLRLVNHFGVVQKQLSAALGRDLILLTITFDPIRDTPEVLAQYARRWQASPETWRFLTGDAAAVRRVLDLFGVDAFPNEGLMDHSLHTVFIDRAGRLAANIEGNQYSADQLVGLARTLVEKKR